MEINEVIIKLTSELEDEVRKGNYKVIKSYIQMAIVVGLEQPLIVNKRVIQMIDSGANLIKEFDRIIDAVQFVKKYKKLKGKKQTIYTNLWRSLTNKKHTSYGYHWRYK